MISNAVSITIAPNPDQATDYNLEDNPPTPVKWVSSEIVAKGTEAGNPSVDMILTDDKGNRYLVMTTIGMIDGLAAAMRGVRDRG